MILFKDPKLSLMAIQDYHVYYDKLSEETASSRRIKPKYKLAGLWPESLRSQNVRLFFISTGQTGRNNPADEICVIHPDDYLMCSSGALRNMTSYYSLHKYEVLDADAIHQKRTDSRNGFRDVATLRDDAFDRFNTYLHRLKLRPNQAPKELVSIVESVVRKELSDKTLKQLHLI